MLIRQPVTEPKRRPVCRSLSVGVAISTKAPRGVVTDRPDACEAVEGMHAKIAFASNFNIDKREDLVEGTVDDLLLSAAMDYVDLSGKEARA